MNTKGIWHNMRSPALPAMAIFLTLMACSSSVAQKKAVDETVLKVGDSVEHARRVLQRAGRTIPHGGFAVVFEKDRDHLSCVIDPNHVYGAIWYTKSTQTVTGISLVFFPQQKHTKTMESWMLVRSIRFEPDGSYRVHFEPPVKESPATPHPAPNVSL